jgi:hypothetical protein
VKSGSPIPKLSIVLPAAFNSAALLDMLTVADSLISLTLDDTMVDYIHMLYIFVAKGFNFLR